MRDTLAMMWNVSWNVVQDGRLTDLWDFVWYVEGNITLNVKRYVLREALLCRIGNTGHRRDGWWDGWRQDLLGE